MPVCSPSESKESQKAAANQPEQAGGSLSLSVLRRVLSVMVEAKESPERLRQLLEYTSGRWVCDEEYQLALRRVSFNQAALRVAASKLLDVAFVSIDKIMEGRFSKMYALKGVTEKEAAVMVPTPGAGDPYDYIANLAATMDFLRNIVGIPVPRVLEWSNRNSKKPASNKPVGIDYLIMEKPRGIKLKELWEHMDEGTKFKVLKEITKVENEIVRRPLPRYGSIYYKEDSPTGVCLNPIEYLDIDGDDVSRFVIGPVTERCFLGNERRGMTVDRGPWRTVEQFFTAIVKREIAWAEQHYAKEITTDRMLFTEQMVLNPKEHIDTLEKFLVALPHIVPKDDILPQPTLWNGDLRLENIFVDANNPTKITDIVDWQTAFVGPLFTQAKIATLAEVPGPYVWGTHLPDLVQENPHASDAEKVHLKERSADLRLKKYYEMASRKYNRDVAVVFDIMRSPHHDQDPTTYLFDILNHSQDKGAVSIIIKTLLMDMCEKWDDIVVWRKLRPVDCPISFDGGEISAALKVSREWKDAVRTFERTRNSVAATDGWVPHTWYDVASHLFKTSKNKLVDQRKALEKITNRAR